MPVCSTSKTLTPTHKKPVKEDLGTPVTVVTSRTSLKSNQTITRDIMHKNLRRTEFNKAEKRTNELHQELVELRGVQAFYLKTRF